jgi:hypothetical protein
MSREAFQTSVSEGNQTGRLEPLYVADVPLLDVQVGYSLPQNCPYRGVQFLY